MADTPEPDGLLRTIEHVTLDSLVEFPGNPRRGDIPALRESLEQNDQYEPIVVQASTRYVLAGNHRVQAAKDLGWDKIAAVVIDVGDDHARRIALSSNRIADLGTYEDELLLEQMKLLDAEDAFIGTGYSDVDYKDLERRMVHFLASAEGKEDEAPPVPETPKSKLGEVYELGVHRLMCGDSTKADDVALLMGGEKAALLVTDPPYGVSYADKNAFLNSYDEGNRIQSPLVGDHQTPEEMQAFWTAAFATVRPHMAPGAAYYTTGPQGGDLLLLLLSLRDAGFPLRHMLIWAKNNLVLGRSDYHYKHEPILYGWVEGAHRFYGPPGETSVWEIDRPHESKLHPTMKPVGLPARAIENSSQLGDIVLDPFAGAGSTMIAAESIGRRCFTMELDSSYVDVCRQRFADFVNDPRLCP